jgi:hypothetical protein
METAIKSRLSSVAGEDITSYVAKRGAIEIIAELARVSTPAGPRPNAQQPVLDAFGAPVDPSAPPSASGPAGPGVVGGQPVDDVGPYTGALAGAGFGATRTGADGQPIVDPTGAGAGAPAAGADGGEAEGAIATAPDSGIAWDDELYFTKIDVRPQLMSLRASSTRGSTKERLQVELEKITCVQNVKNGKTQDANERKLWNIDISHDCFHGPLGGES